MVDNTMSETEQYPSRINAYHNDPHIFQFIAKVQDGDNEKWIKKYDEETGYELVTQKALFHDYNVKEFYVFLKNKQLEIKDKQISIPHPYVGVNLRNGDITINDAVHSFQEDFDEELKDLDLIYYWSNLLVGTEMYDGANMISRSNHTYHCKRYGIGWKNGVGKRIIQFDADTQKFHIKTKK